jgi:FtsP/CotA-like multicopper oxidase with cupredoxin domain
VIAFAEIDENASWYIEHNVETYGSPAAKRLITFDFADPFFISNLMPTINGFLYGHTPGLTMQVGERVRWYVFATTGFELHAPHWHGQTAVMNHMRTDAFGLLTMEMAVADMVPDNPGTWLFHCHVGPHNDGGMQALFTVRQQVAAR